MKRKSVGILQSTTDDSRRAFAYLAQQEWPRSELVEYGSDVVLAMPVSSLPGHTSSLNNEFVLITVRKVPTGLHLHLYKELPDGSSVNTIVSVPSYQRTTIMRMQELLA